MKVIRIGDFITEISDKTTTNNQYMVLTSSQEGIVSQDEYFNKQVASKDTTGYKIVKRGQFTYRAMSDTGRFYINQLTQYEVGIVSPAYPVFEVIENDTLHPSFLHMFFRSEYFQALIANQSSGSTRVSLRMDKIKKIELAVPEYEDQIHIVEKIAKMETIIADRKQQLALLDELVKSRFIELFGECEERKRLEEYASLITKGASPKWQGVDYCEEGTLFVTSENVREGYLDLSKRKYLDDKINEIQPRSILKRNDILINIVGASIGRAAVYDCDEVANINQAVALVRVDYSQINQTYLMAFLNSPQAIEMYGKMKKGGARDNLSLQNIADLQIPVAPMELQNQFATFVKQTDKSKLAVQKGLRQLEILKKSLMQQYFG